MIIHTSLKDIINGYPELMTVYLLKLMTCAIDILVSI